MTSKTTLNFLTRFSSWETVFQVKFINITRSRQCNERCWKCTCVCSAKEYRALFHWSERNCDKYRESITVSLYSFMRHYESSDTSETVTCTLPYLHLKCCWQGLSRPLHKHFLWRSSELGQPQKTTCFINKFILQRIIINSRMHWSLAYKRLACAVLLVGWTAFMVTVSSALLLFTIK